jgi:D-alanyl-lipoteichoic acid acyltransferase DltB (MBOAT superfamily)
MLFNSRVFVLFFIVVYTAYLLLQRKRDYKTQNVLLLAASYFFYACWDYRFLGLLVLQTGVDFYLARLLGYVSGPRKRKLVMVSSIVFNLTMLGFFKYFNFFTTSFAELGQRIGVTVDPVTLNIVLPVGISFYTFHTMSYTIDVYMERIRPAEHLLEFSLFVAYFPLLVAGPIERTSNLLPQLSAPREIRVEQLNAGLFLILWGYFKKIVVADNLALIANPIFQDYQSYSGFEILLGVLAFTFQIYGDFSGYTDIARGLSKLMGIELLLNFRLPYFAVSPPDFWRRWHISLSSWLRDYLYIPLGGNRHGEAKTYRNLAATMLLAGLWHGAAWNFVIWGAYHGLILIGHRLFSRATASETPTPALLAADGPLRSALWASLLAPPTAVLRILPMFALTVIGWIIFRATSVHQIVYMITHLSVVPSGSSGLIASHLALFVVPLLVLEWYQHRRGDLLALAKLPLWSRVPLYAGLLLSCFILGRGEGAQFIYFQF